MKATATEVKNRFGEYLEHAAHEPVEVQKSGRSVAVLLSRREYDRLSALEDRYWGEQAREAAKSAYMGSDETLAAIARKMEMVNSEDDAK